MIAQFNIRTFIPTSSAAHSVPALPLREGRNRHRRFRGGVAEIDRVSHRSYRKDRIANRCPIGHHIGIRKAQDRETLGSQPRISNAIGAAGAVSKVLATVDLDNNFPFEAYEVSDIAADWRLPAKAQAFQLTSAKQIPESELRRRQASAHHLSKLAIDAPDRLMRHSCFGALTPPRNRFAVSALPQGEGFAANLHLVRLGRPMRASS